MNLEVTGFIEAAPSMQQPILSALRKLILAQSPDVEEQFKWSRPVYALEKDFCYLKSTKKSVTLGFFEFDKIKTNNHLIEGTGKSMRHIKINSLDDIENSKVESMIKEVLS